MTERQQHYPSDGPAPMDRTSRDPQDPTTGINILGSGTDAPSGATSTGGVPGDAGAATGGPVTRPVAVRRADVVAGLLLVLAGLAAALSLLLRWLKDADITGWDLVRRGIDEFGQGAGELIRSGFWQPLAVVFGGAVLLLIGLLMFVPARGHRFLGLVALLVALVATTAVLVPLVRAGWDLSPFDLGMWSAIAVPGLGFLGALKALATPRQRAPRPPRH